VRCGAVSVTIYDTAQFVPSIALISDSEGRLEGEWGGGSGEEGVGRREWGGGSGEEGVGRREWGGEEMSMREEIEGRDTCIPPQNQLGQFSYILAFQSTGYSIHYLWSIIIYENRVIC